MEENSPVLTSRKSNLLSSNLNVPELDNEFKIKLQEMNVNGSTQNDIEKTSDVKKEIINDENNSKNEYTKKLEEELKEFACEDDKLIETSK